MGLEVILSEIAIKKDRLFISLGQGDEHLGSVYINDYQHIHSTKILTRQEKQRILEKIANDPILNQFEVRTPQRIPRYNIVQVIGSLGIRDRLKQKIGGVFNIGNYLQQARWNFAPEGAVMDVDETLMQCLELQKEINQDLAELKEEVRQHIEPQYKNPRSKKSQSKGLYKGLMKKTLTKARQKKLKPGFEEKRQAISQKRKTLKEKLAEINGTATVNLEENQVEIYINNKNNDKIQYKRMMTAQEYWERTRAVLDIEVPLWEYEEREVTHTVITFSKGDEVKEKEYHIAHEVLHQVGVTELDGYRVLEYPGEAAKIKGLRDSINRKKATMLFAYNNNYDFRNLRDAGEFEIGLRETHPLVQASKKFFERIATKGAFVIDLLRIAQTQFPHLMHRKLELVAREEFGDERFGKSLNYDQIAEIEFQIKDETLPIEIRAGGAETIGHYATGDGDIETDKVNSPLFKNQLEIMCRISQILRLPLAKVAHSPRAINEAQERLFFEKVGQPREISHPKHGINVTQENNAKNKFKKTLEDWIWGQEKKGIAKDVTIAYIPIHQFLAKYVGHPDRFPKIHEITKIVEEQEEVLPKFFATSYADALCEYIITDYGQYLRTKKKQQDAGKRLKRAREKLEKHCKLMPGTDRAIRKDYEYTRDGTKTWEALRNQAGWRLTEILEGFTETESTKGPQTIREYADAYVEYMISLSRLRWQNRKFAGNYQVTTRKIDQEIQQGIGNIKKQLEERRCEVVQKKGRYLYIEGDAEGIEELILLKKLRTVMHTNTTYYEDHGFLRGFKKDRKPTDKKTVFEIDGLKGFVKLMMKGEVEEALRSIKQHYDKLEQYDPNNPEEFFQKHPKKEFVRYVKGSGLYTSWQDQEEIQFFESEEKANKHTSSEIINPDEGFAYSTKLKKKKGKEEETTYYIMGVEDLNPDIDHFATQLVFKYRDVLGDLIGYDTAIDLFLQPMDEEKIKRIAASIK